jgi:cation diffusion facilitator family transporter
MTSPATPTAPAPADLPGAHSAKRGAAIFSVIAAALVTTLKLLTGLLTGSLGMLSEATHSGIDLIAAAITLVSVQVSDLPADDEHNYGHGKVESLAAFIETGIMIASAAWIVYEALSRIVQRHLSLHTSFWPFAVLVFSIAVDFSRSRTLGRIARLHHSEALAADSIHFATDMWASLAVIVGLAASYMGQRFALPWLEFADPIAALVVAGIILRVSWQLAHQTIDALLDATPTTDPTSGQSLSSAEAKDQLRANLLHDLAAIPGVLSVERLRTRRSGSSYFADVTLGLPRNLTFQSSEQVTLAATAAVQRHLPAADVVVHTVPTASLAESVHDRIRAVAARRNLAIHEISVQQISGLHHDRFHPSLHIEQHLEVDETMPLLEAHDLVTQLEAEMRREVPAIASILTHIESEPATIERPAALKHDRDLELRLRRVATTFPEILDIHEVYVTRRSVHADHLPSSHTEYTQVTCHCTLPDDLPMARVHAVMSALEGAFKIEAPEVDRLLIHPEPATDNRR